MGWGNPPVVLELPASATAGLGTWGLGVSLPHRAVVRCCQIPPVLKGYTGGIQQEGK